ncbi:MAG: MmgE/PrpD family protein [Kiloniellales bacterium]|nr:MmgE/PrpD family protein [Kiloniellales bacterium]
MAKSEASAVERIAAFVATVPQVRNRKILKRAERALFDTLGCIIYGISSPPAQAALRTVRPWGRGKALAFGTRDRLTPPGAALVNGTAAHAFDLDDYDLPGNSHPSAVVFPSVLAAIPDGEGAGLDLLDAYVVGLEVIMRLGEAVNMSHYTRGWHTTATLGSLGAAAACARVLGHDAARTAHALSFATSMGTGYVSQFGTMAKPLHAGLAAQNGLLAAHLAASGATGSTTVLDGPAGFATLMVDPGAADFDRTLGRLGKPWGIVEHGLAEKAYPCCGYLHRTIGAALSLKRDRGVAPEDVVSMTVSVPDFHLAILPYGVPQTVHEAMFSPAYCAAAALLQGHLGLDDFTDTAVARQAVRDLAALVTVEGRVPRDPALNLDPDDPDRVTVTLRDGREISAEMGHPLGSTVNPMSDEALDAKFMACVTKRFNQDRAEALRSAVSAMRENAPLSILLDSLTP